MNEYTEFPSKENYNVNDQDLEGFVILYKFVYFYIFLRFSVLELYIMQEKLKLTVN